MEIEDAVVVEMLKMQMLLMLKISLLHFTKMS